MLKRAYLTALLLALATTTPAVFARGGGGPGGGHGGGKGGAHMSAPGATNTNAQNLPGSSRGQDRAQERMSDQGLAHQKSGKKKDGAAGAGLPLPPVPKKLAPPKPPLP